MEPVLTAAPDTLFRHYVSGRWTDVDGVRLVERRNPADRDDLIGYVPLGSASHIDAAVDAAVDAAPAWRDTPAPIRGRILFNAAHLLQSCADEFATMITREQGKTLKEAAGEVQLAVKTLEYVAGDGRRMPGETLPSEHRGRFVYTIREPLGVVGLITPWNFPLGVPVWKIAPALVCGNAIVWKPSRLTPMVSNRIAVLLAEAGVPAGVLNVVHGAGGEAGSALVEHPQVRAISFTSSYETGTTIYAQAARLFKKVQCEAGGKNAVIVMPDADLDAAADAVARGAFQYAGQRCTATSRVIVVGSVGDRFVEMVGHRADALTVGNGLHPDTDLGPISDAHQMRRIMQFIQVGRREARLVCGGTRLDGPVHEAGLFVAPTIFDHVHPASELAREEIFGPVLSIVRAADFPEALACANDNRYGMVTSIFTQRLAWALEAAERLQSGIVHINGATITAEPHAPFGGIKDTGVGDRELGTAAHQFYSELKVVYVNRA
jgi:acyl-CoA reductase-like NAD-dependent aldehyde dehydrogenase